MSNFLKSSPHKVSNRRSQNTAAIADSAFKFSLIVFKEYRPPEVAEERLNQDAAAFIQKAFSLYLKSFLLPHHLSAEALELL